MFGVLCISLLLSGVTAVSWADLASSKFKNDAWCDRIYSHRTNYKKLQLSEVVQCVKGMKDDMEKPNPLKGLVFLENNHVLAFRATAGIGQSAYDRYAATGTSDDTPLARSSLPCGCLTVNSSLPCNTHYRSRILDDWPSNLIDTPGTQVYAAVLAGRKPKDACSKDLGIRWFAIENGLKVRLTLYQNGVAQRFVEFNGTGSTYLNWFSPDRLVASDWTDLAAGETTNVFSIEGIVMASPAVDRRFYINRNFGGCVNGDAGWLIVAEGPDVCPFVPSEPFPIFLYSSPTTFSVWSKCHVMQADVFTITVKFKPDAVFDGKCMGRPQGHPHKHYPH